MKEISKEWFEQSVRDRYSYRFKWMGRPIIQYPQDIVAFQEIVMEVRPNTIIETGVAHGGSLLLSASLLAMLDVLEDGDPKEGLRDVIGLEKNLSEDAAVSLGNHPLNHMIHLLQGDSVDRANVWHVNKLALDPVLVSLDSNHTHEHVLAELNAYAPLVTKGSYCIVYDTCIEGLPDLWPDRPWGKGNNPKTAVDEWLPQHPEFEIDEAITERLEITTATYLRRVT